MLEKVSTGALASDDEAGTSAPLYVSLERALLRTGLEAEALLAMIASAPRELLRLPGAMLGGRSKIRTLLLCQAATLDAGSMPYVEEVLGLLRKEHARGRSIILVSDVSVTFAERVAQALGLFDGVIGADESVPSGQGAMLARVLDHAGERAFDYVGGGEADLDIWRAARTAIVAGGSPALISAVRGEMPSNAVIPRQSPGIMPYVRALRPHQWVKNLLVFLPLLAAHRYGEPSLIAPAVLAFLALNLAASGTYVINDLLDLRADRQHPRKRLRPMASGNLPIVRGSLLAPLCLAAAAVLSAALPISFALTLGLYVVVTLAYSWHLKLVPMVDVLVLSGLFTLRVFAGGAAVAIAPSFWLLTFSIFVFLSLALVKRYIELQSLRDAGRNMAAGRGYHIDDLPLLLAMGIASGFVSVLVVALYVNSPEIRMLYRFPVAIWALCIVHLYIVARMWMTAHRGDMHDDPVVFVLRDRGCLLALVIAAIAVVIAGPVHP